MRLRSGRQGRADRRRGARSHPLNRIARTFERLGRERRKALAVYLTAGDPDLETTVALVLEAARRGADLVELGVPFSDPTADGPIIQRAAERAIRGGTTLAATLEALSRIRRETDVPIVLFGYYNPFFTLGRDAGPAGPFRADRLARAVAGAGADGILVVDLPIEELSEIQPACDAAGLDTIVLVAPTTPPARVDAAVRLGRGFLYYIAVTGVTGARDRVAAEVADKAAAVKARSRLPVVVGFGISTPEQAREAARHADGVAVGSAVVRLVEAHAGRPRAALVAAAGDFIASLKGVL